MMSDLISRQKAIDALNKLDVSDGVGISSVACNLQEEAIRSIENLLSTDVEPVRHGWWIYDESIDMFTCSVCEDMMARNTYRFCPWCGARMDGE